MNLSLLRVAFGALVMFWGPAILAHEFWMLPDSFEVAAGGSSALSLTVGQNFSGDRVGISRSLVADFRHYAEGVQADLREQIPAGRALGELAVAALRPGTHLFAMNSNPSAIVLPADKFMDYLRLEGLTWVIDAREKSGTTLSPGRERYRRNIKTLVRVGAKSDATFARRIGQRLEIVPMSDPFKLGSGGRIAFQLTFDGQALPGSLVKFWHATDGPPLALTGITDQNGMVGMALPQPGVWMVSVVHMIAATDTPEFDWDSYWGNLTFSVPDGR
jgi:hypothetical protein